MEDKPPNLDFPAPFGKSGKAKSEKPDTPPKPRGRPKGSSNKSTLTVRKIEESLTEQFTIIGISVMAVNAYDGQVILDGSPRLAKSIADLCDKNPKLKKAIERMLLGGGYAQVAISFGMILLPILSNHNLLPNSPFQQLIPSPVPTESENGNGPTER